MEIILAALGLLLAVIIPFIPYVYKRYYQRPILDLMLKPNGGSSAPNGLSRNNDFSKGYVDADEAMRFFELEWRVFLTIVNNSEITAYYPKLSYLKESPAFDSPFENVSEKPILSAEQVTLNYTYRETEECIARNRTVIGHLPEAFNKLKLLLEYKNGYGTIFYTVFDYSNKVEPNKHFRNKKNIEAI